MDPDDLTARRPPAPPARAMGPRLLAAAVVAAATTVPFTVLTALVLSRSGPLRAWDASIVDAVHGEVAVRPDLARLLGWLSVATHPTVVRLVTAVVVLLLWRRGRRRRAWWLAATVAVGGALGPLLKESVARARPAFEHPVALAPGYSFPSGHALNSMLLAACLVLLLHGATRGRPLRRAALWAGALALVLVTGADRVGLGVHYTTDVVAGWLVGLLTVAITTVAFESWRRREGLPPSSSATGLDPGPDDVPERDAPGPRDRVTRSVR